MTIIEIISLWSSIVTLISFLIFIIGKLLAIKERKESIISECDFSYYPQNQDEVYDSISVHPNNYNGATYIKSSMGLKEIAFYRINDDQLNPLELPECVAIYDKLPRNQVLEIGKHILQDSIDYFKEKPSVAIAIGSLAIAVGTALLNLLAYLIDKRYLAFWNVSEDFIQINSIKTIYFIFALLLTSAFSVIFQLWSNSIMQKHFKSIRPMMVVDMVLGSLKKTIKKDRKSISKRRKELKKLEANKKEKPEKTTNTKEQIEKLEQTNKKLKDETEDIRKESRKDARKYKVFLFAMIGIMIFLQTIITLVYMWINASSTNNVIIPSIVISVIMIVPFCSFKYFYYKK